ncbi:hypothetical protein HY631_01860 [Candidatus Uhrbacteria bacterium]|nr:hypothetical protein [Candidatus Uhrbacteria bacterium]
MDKALEHLLGTIVQMRKDEESALKEEDVIKVSDTVSVAASVYETVRNTLEYDDEHLLRRNAIRRILKRRLGEDSDDLASKLLQELIWARYLPNGRVPTKMIGKIGAILEKYKTLFATLDPESPEGQAVYPWLLDVLSVEVEYVLGPPCIDEALASFAYQELKARVDWQTRLVGEEDRELQLYIAIHRNVLKSNRATLRYRTLTLYYPGWRKAEPGDVVVRDVAMNLVKVVDSVERQIDHPAQDAVYRFVRRHTVVFHLLADIARDNPEAFARSLQAGDVASIDTAITKAAQARYGVFRSRLVRTVVRAALFLLLTKSILALLVEYPYEFFVLHSTDYLPLTVNILFPPLLLAFVGVTVRIPKKENTAKILDEIHGILGVGDDFALTFKRRRPWARGALYWIFNGLYVAVLVVTLALMIGALRALAFNALSIFFFLFFLSLVAYFGLRIRNTKRELMVLETARGFFGTIIDILTLPIVRAGRWVAMRAPRVNIFLFFFDFIIEAPFKAAIGIVESWLGFLREKREEI